jgi:hypothetical protein
MTSSASIAVGRRERHPAKADRTPILTTVRTSSTQSAASTQSSVVGGMMVVMSIIR